MPTKITVTLKLDDKDPSADPADLLEVLAWLGANNAPAAGAVITYECEEYQADRVRDTIRQVLRRRASSLDAKIKVVDEESVDRFGFSVTIERPAGQTPIERAINEAETEAEPSGAGDEAAVEQPPTCSNCGRASVTPPQTFCSACLDLPDSDEQED